MICWILNENIFGEKRGLNVPIDLLFGQSTFEMYLQNNCLMKKIKSVFKLDIHEIYLKNIYIQQEFYHPFDYRIVNVVDYIGDFFSSSWISVQPYVNNNFSFFKSKRESIIKKKEFQPDILFLIIHDKEVQEKVVNVVKLKILSYSNFEEVQKEILIELLYIIKHKIIKNNSISFEQFKNLINQIGIKNFLNNIPEEIINDIINEQIALLQNLNNETDLQKVKILQLIDNMDFINDFDLIRALGLKKIIKMIGYQNFINTSLARNVFQIIKDDIGQNILISIYSKEFEKKLNQEQVKNIHQDIFNYIYNNTKFFKIKLNKNKIAFKEITKFYHLSFIYSNKYCHKLKLYTYVYLDDNNRQRILLSDSNDLKKVNANSQLNKIKKVNLLFYDEPAFFIYGNNLAIVIDKKVFFVYENSPLYQQEMFIKNEIDQIEYKDEIENDIDKEQQIALNIRKKKYLQTRVIDYANSTKLFQNIQAKDYASRIKEENKLIIEDVLKRNDIHRYNKNTYKRIKNKKIYENFIKKTSAIYKNFIKKISVIKYFHKKQKQQVIESQASKKILLEQQQVIESQYDNIINLDQQLTKTKSKISKPILAKEIIKEIEKLDTSGLAGQHILQLKKIKNKAEKCWKDRILKSNIVLKRIIFGSIVVSLTLYIFLNDKIQKKLKISLKLKKLFSIDEE